MKYTKGLFLQASRNYSKSYEKYKSLLTPIIEDSFKKSLNKIVDDVSMNKSYLCLAGVKDHIIKTAQYNTKVGNNPSSIIMLHFYNILEQTPNLTEEARHKVFALAWAIEMLQSYNILADPKRTWPELETNTISGDSSLLRSFIYDMLDDNWEGYLHKHILQLFDKGFLFKSLGNHLDNYTASKGKGNNFSEFNLNTFATLCEYKTAYNTFKLPFFITSHVIGKYDKAVIDNFDKIGSDLSKLYQMQEEYEDCFGGESKTYRSSGTDIQEGKCTWFAVNALQRCTAAQRIVFNVCYSSKEPAHVERIKLLYEQLKIPQIYRHEEGALCESIMQRAESIENAGIPLATFSKLLDVMYQGNCNKRIFK